VSGKDEWPGTELVSCRLLSLEKFTWRLCTARSAAREGRWEEASRHHGEAYCLFDELHWYGPVTSWTRFEVSPELDGVGTSLQPGRRVGGEVRGGGA